MGRGKGRITVRGDSLIVDFYFQGERFRAAIPGLSANKKAHHATAEGILTQIQADIAKGCFNLAQYFLTHPKASRFRKGSGIRISEKLDVWIEFQRRRCAKSTWRDYKSAIEYHLRPYFGDLFMADLTAGHIREWMGTLDISNKRIKNVLIPLKAVFQEAYEDHLIDANPLDRLKQLSTNTPEPKPFSREEMESILAACEGQVKNIFQFAFWTGLRTSELIALEWTAINLKNKTAFIRQVRTRSEEKDHPKTAAGIRSIELLPPALGALRAQKKYTTEGPIFLNPRTGKPWLHDGPLRKTAWKKALEVAEVPYRKTYNTRHTFASMMLSSGMPPMWVAQQMGHKDWGMIRKVYGRWIPDVDPSIQDKISFLWSQHGHKGAASG